MNPLLPMRCTSTLTSQKNGRRTNARIGLSTLFLLAKTGWVGRVATARLTNCRAPFSSDCEQTTFIVLTT